MATIFDISQLKKTKDYWGPDKELIFDQYKNLPFAPFSKLEKIGKCIDFTSGKGGHNMPFEEEDEFMLVETKMHIKTKGTTSNFRKKQMINKKNYGAGNKLDNKQISNYRQPIQKFNPYYQRINYTRTKFKDNSLVKADWPLIMDVQKGHLDKLSLSSLPEAETLLQVGSVREFDKKYEIITLKTEKPLQCEDSFVVTMPTRKDPNMNEFISRISNVKENVGVEDQDSFFSFFILLDSITLYTTDRILISLMTLKHSIIPFEITAIKGKNFIILDKPILSSYIDLLTAGENLNGNMPEEEKDFLKLCFEASNINSNFHLQTCTGEELNFSENKASSQKKVSWKYRKFALDKRINVVVRVEVESYYRDSDGNPVEILVKAFNEFDLNNEWRKKLQANQGAVLSQELRNNVCKISKWLCQAELADIKELKIGYVSRISAKDVNKHSILRVEKFTVKELAQSISFKMRENWGVVKYFVDLLMKQPDGTFDLVKLAHKPQVRVYRVAEEKEDDNI